MYFANPWGLMGLFSLPVIVFIHLYHRRFPPLPVAGLHLWTQETKKDSPGRKREQLPITRSLILELLAALLLSLLLADPRDASTTTQPHLVIVLDNSASMLAEANGVSTRDRVIAWLESQRDYLGRGGVTTMLVTGRRPSLIAGPRGEWEDVLKALENWQPQAARHDFQPAWDLAAQLAQDDSRFVFLTDQLPDNEQLQPERMEIVSLGRRLNNVAIIAARWLFDGESGEGTLFLRLANFSSEPTNVRLNAASGQTQVLQENVSMDADSETSLEWTVPGGLRELKITATSVEDALPLDNQIVLLEPEVRTVTVAVTLPSDHTSFEPVKQILGVLPNVQLGTPSEADLIIAAATASPSAQRSKWWLGLGPLSAEETTPSKALLGPYLIEKRHPLMNEIVLGGVVLGGVQSVPEQLQLIPIISTGSSLLLGQFANTAAESYVANFDLASSNLTESPDWPIFWTNLIEECRMSRPGFRRWNFRLDEPISFTLAPDIAEKSDELFLEYAGEQKSLVRMERVEISPRLKTGVYSVKDGEQLLDRFAVNYFDREESNLSQLLPGEKVPELPQPALGIHLENPFSWILVVGILAVIAAILWDWSITRSRSLAM